MRVGDAPDSWLPFSPTEVSYPAGNAEMKLCMFALLAAETTSSIVTSRLLSPYLMLSAMVVSKRTGS